MVLSWAEQVQSILDASRSWRRDWGWGGTVLMLSQVRLKVFFTIAILNLLRKQPKKCVLYLLPKTSPLLHNWTKVQTKNRGGGVT